LDYLRRYQVDGVKIDRRFVKEIGLDARRPPSSLPSPAWRTSWA